MKAVQPRLHASRASRPPTPADLARLVPWRPLLGFVLIVAAALLLLRQQIDIREVHAAADRLPAGLAFALLAILPLIGFPVSVLHVAAGIRFGVPLGLALVALSILFQLLVSYALARRFRDHFAKWLGRLRKRIPDGAHASICIFTVLLPGAPYAAVNYVLPSIGVPLRTYVLCCLPLHTLRSTITVTLGDQSDQLTPARLAVLGGYALLILSASWWTYRRMQLQLASRPAAAGDRTPRA